MAQALAQAAAAAGRDEVPVGAVLVHQGRVVAGAGNQRHELSDPTAHAEILVLRAAAAVVGDWRLSGHTLYVTLEPCPMCISACRQARLDLVVWGAGDEVQGACGTVLDLAEDPRFGAPLAHRGGLAGAEASQLLREFFAKRRDSG